LRKLRATGSNSETGMRLLGKGSRTQLPLTCRVVNGSKIGYPSPPKLKSPFSIASVGTCVISVSEAFSWCRYQPSRKKLRSRPL